MRLGQLSRQLDVSSDQIAKLLNENFREVSSHPNVKLTEEELEFVQNQFAPAVEEVVTETKAAETPDIEAVTEEKEEVLEEKETPEFVESLRPQVITLEEEFNAQTDGLELYKAEKPHLEGLKVVGKIDLPEPVVKEQPEEAPKPVRQTRDRKSNRRDDRGKRKNTPSLVEERKKEERLAKKRKFEEEQKLKELKKKHYEENVKAKLVKPAPKKKRKAVQETATYQAPTTSTVSKSPSAKKASPSAKNPLKRFWLWLNGAYDN